MTKVDPRSADEGSVHRSRSSSGASAGNRGRDDRIQATDRSGIGVARRVLVGKGRPACEPTRESVLPSKCWAARAIARASDERCG
jgi:hypothetical protein